MGRSEKGLSLFNLLGRERGRKKYIIITVVNITARDIMLESYPEEINKEFETFYLNAVQRSNRYDGKIVRRDWTVSVDKAMKFDKRDEAESTINHYLSDKKNSVDILKTK